MQIGDIVKLDQKNRLHIPNTLMKEAGIEPNDEVIVYMEVGDGCILIQSKKKYDELKKEMLKIGFNMPECLISANEDDKIKVVEGQNNESI